MNKKRNERWVAVGVQLVRLGGDNTSTPVPNDRVDVLGIMPVVNVYGPRGLAFGGGVGFRKYWTPAGSFNQANVEVWVKLRPFRLNKKISAMSGPSLRHDWLEFRLGTVFHPAIDAGRLGAGSSALGADWSPVFLTVINLVR